MRECQYFAPNFLERRVMFTKEDHTALLKSHFPHLPDPDRKEPYTPCLLPGISTANAAFPEEAQKDHKPGGLKTRDEKESHFALMDAYLQRGVPVGWISMTKNPVTGEAKTGYKQGMCLDRPFLVGKYDQLIKDVGSSLHLGYHSNMNNVGFIMDLDFKEGECDAAQTFFAFLKNNGVDPTQIPCVLTPGGGLHLYFQQYEGLHTSTSNFAPDVWGAGVDPRGDGAFVVAPGSYIKFLDGQKIAFKQYMVITNGPLPPLPQCIIDVFESRCQKRNTSFSVPSGFLGKTDNDELDKYCAKMMRAVEGERNSTLYKVAFPVGKMIRDGLVAQEEAEEKLMNAGLSTGLSEKECAATIRSGFESGMSCDDPYIPYSKFCEDESAVEEKPEMTTNSFKTIVAEPRKIKSVRQEEAPEDFLREKEWNDNCFSRGRLTQFAERNGEINDEKVDEIAKSIFPDRIYDMVKMIHESQTLDYASVVQATLCMIGNALKGARLVSTGGSFPQEMGANQYLAVIGAPTSGKSTLLRILSSSMNRRQVEEHNRFKLEWDEYIKAKRKFESKRKGEELPEPVRPIPWVFSMTDGTIEAVLDKAEYNPTGIFWALDEGAGQANLGADRYNKNCAADVLGKLIVGHDGGYVASERKNKDNQINSRYIERFILSIWLNCQTGKIKETFSAALETQGYLPRFLFLTLPPRSEGKLPSPLFRGEKSINTDFYDAVINKLLDLRIGQNDETENLSPLLFTQEAVEYFNHWHESFTESCNYGALRPWVGRFVEHVIRFALTLHYLRLAAHCVKNDQDIKRIEERERQDIELIDVQGAIAVADIFLKKIDEFRWLLNKTEKKAQSGYLDKEQEALAKHVIANHDYYNEPRSAKEIIAQGYRTGKEPKDLCRWLKAQGFTAISKTSTTGRSHKEIKFMLSGLEPWSSTIDMSRLAFSEDDQIPVAKAIYGYRDIIETSGFELSSDEFTEVLNCGEDSPNLIKKMIACEPFLVSEKNGRLLFRKESIDFATRLLAEEGLLIDGKLTSDAA